MSRGTNLVVAEVDGAVATVTLDEDTKRGIVDAYKTTCNGYSTDFVLCDPELNQGFVAACKKNSLPGNAFAWNRLLLRIRKSGQLPKLQRTRKPISLAAMDSYSAASEAAMQLLHLDYRCVPLLKRWRRTLRSYRHRLVIDGWNDYLRAILAMEDWDGEMEDGTPGRIWRPAGAPTRSVRRP